MEPLCDAIEGLRATLPKISVDEAIDALRLTGDNPADMLRIVDYAFDIVGKLHRNIAAQWSAIEMIAARVDAQTAAR